MTKKRVLIAYATRYGSTEIISNDIKEKLEAIGAKVELLNLRNAKKTTIKAYEQNLDSYNLVIIGSSVAMFRWIGKAKKFLKKFRHKEIPLVVFACCGTAIDDFEKAQRLFIDRILHRLKVKSNLSQPICPCLDFRPDSPTLSPKKDRIKGLIQNMAKNKYDENGLIDMRDMTRYNGFIGKIEELLAV